MKCPYCGGADNKVVDSRESETGEAIRRRRECLSCGKRFTTYERIEAVPLYVVKKYGRREEFSHRKLLSGLLVATKKRELSPARLEAMVDEIESDLRTRNLTEVPSRVVGEIVMEKLRLLDEIAYVRFASVYRSFKDLGEFMSELKELIHERKGKQK